MLSVLYKSVAHQSRVEASWDLTSYKGCTCFRVSFCSPDWPESQPPPVSAFWVSGCKSTSPCQIALSSCPNFSVNFSSKMQKYKLFLIRFMKLGMRENKNKFNILVMNQLFVNASEAILLNDLWLILLIWVQILLYSCWRNVDSCNLYFV